jgi:hypothetical protein
MESALPTVIEDRLMDRYINPFHELYVTETARPEEFVQLFSPLLVPQALLLFQPGNVVLKGTQGSGKSMLLNLLRPEIRCAYNHARHDFPVPNKFGRFMSAGINLTRSGVLDIGQRPLTKDSAEDERLFPLFFADFVNYWVVRDIMRTIQSMESHRKLFSYVKFARKDEFAKLLAAADCWFGYLAEAKTFGQLMTLIDGRIQSYRSFHVYNSPQLPQSVVESKTNIGEPISQAFDCLGRSGTLDDRIPLFVRIDQHEVLSRSDDLRPKVGIEYRRIINKALSRRDPRVSYRIGTRRYAWGDDLSVYGTTMSLEILRDYRVIDIDDLLRRKENPETWMFPHFAEDIFARRLHHAKFSVNPDKSIRRVMGQSPSPHQAAKDYVGTTGPERALNIEDSWPVEWRELLVRIYSTDPLSAKLAEAWLRQRSGENARMPVPHHGPWPWDRVYWKKERARQALFQLAARCAQRPLWYGRENILGLCMGGTLTFVSVCQHIWDAFLRSQLGLSEDQRKDPSQDGIPSAVQALGISSASTYWHGKIVEQPGGSERRRFIDFLGRHFYNLLMEDKAMSYPGRNGFSLPNDELETDPETHRFLGDAVDYGDLQDGAHTTKDKDGRQRTKWYLNPILSPHFRLPESHVKEPLYTDVHSVREWLSDLHILGPSPDGTKKSRTQQAQNGQLTLL